MRVGALCVRILGGAAIAALLIGGSGHAQTLKTIKCEFSTQAVRDWKTGKFNTGTERLSLVFDSIDTTRGTARLIGNAGASDVTVLQTPQAIHFVELTDSGNLTITTAFNQQAGVHSRHMNFQGGPLVSQYYGTCGRF